MTSLPENLVSLHCEEESLRSQSISQIASDDELSRHVDALESGMDLLDIFRQTSTNNEDESLIVAIGIRIFNAQATVFKLAMSGYYQSAALIMRDIMECIFLVDYFRSNPKKIAEWRCASRQEKRSFSPAKIREALDKRDGFISKRRSQAYDQLCELAGHVSMGGLAMLRQGGKDIRQGPFFDSVMLRAVLWQLAVLGIQAGEIFECFFLDNSKKVNNARMNFMIAKKAWIEANGQALGLGGP